MEFPKQLKYSKDHIWIRLEKDSRMAKMGITQFAQQELGQMVYVDVDSVGKSLNKADVFATVEAIKTVSDLLMPIGGKILQANQNLEKDPEILNRDPYEKGWIVEVDVEDKGQMEKLLSAEQYAREVGY